MYINIYTIYDYDRINDDGDTSFGSAQQHDIHKQFVVLVQRQASPEVEYGGKERRLITLEEVCRVLIFVGMKKKT